MEIRGKYLTTPSLDRIVGFVNDSRYEGALRWDTTYVRSSRSGVTLRLKLNAQTGMPGSRNAASGRRGPWACWHAFRDVLAALYRVHPDAVTRTMYATYKGADDFESKFRATYWQSCGSQLYPAYVGPLCAGMCPEAEPEQCHVATASQVSHHAKRAMDKANSLLTEFDAMGLPKNDGPFYVPRTISS